MVNQYVEEADITQLLPTDSEELANLSGTKRKEVLIEVEK